MSIYNQQKKPMSNGDKLGWISLACLVASKILMILNAVFGVMMRDTEYEILEQLGGTVNSLMGLAIAVLSIGGFVVMIVARVDDKNSKVAKVSMWIYITVIIIEIIITIIVIYALVACTVACIDGCQSIGNMG